MTRRVISFGTPARPVTYSDAVIANGLVFISGLNAISDDGNLISRDVVGQTRAIYQKLEGILEEAGSSLSQVLKTTDFILSRDGYAETARIRAEFLGPDFPAATGVVVKELLGRGVLIEIDAIAAVGRNDRGE